jgi:hypothetical protein
MTTTITPDQLPVTEAAFQRTVMALFRLHGWRLWHNHVAWRSEAGWPDLVAVHPAHGIVFLEVKTDAGRVTAAQESWLDALEAAGARVHVLRPRDWNVIQQFARGEA